MTEQEFRNLKIGDKIRITGDKSKSYEITGRRKIDYETGIEYELNGNPKLFANIPSGWELVERASKLYRLKSAYKNNRR